MFLDLSMWLDGLSVVPTWIGCILYVTGESCGTLSQCLPTSLMLARLLRLLRLLKGLKHFDDSAVLTEALRRSVRPLLVPLVFLTIVTFAFAGAVLS